MLRLLKLAVEEIRFTQALPAFPFAVVVLPLQPEEQHDGRHRVVTHMAKTGDALEQPIDRPRPQVAPTKCLALKSIDILVGELGLRHEHGALTVLIPICALQHAALDSFLVKLRAGIGR